MIRLIQGNSLHRPSHLHVGLGEAVVWLAEQEHIWLIFAKVIMLFWRFYRNFEVIQLV